MSLPADPSLDTRPLAQRVTRAEAERHFADSAQEPAEVGAHVGARRGLFRAVAVVGSIIALVGAVVILTSTLTGTGGAVWGGSAALVGGLSAATAYRIARFAEANGLSFRPRPRCSADDF